eukprot:7340800-Pyramimonas_sp.AAC.1
MGSFSRARRGQYHETLHTGVSEGDVGRAACLLFLLPPVGVETREYRARSRTSMARTRSRARRGIVFVNLSLIHI